MIASPKNQAITQGKRPTPNIKPKTKFSAKCGDRNPILRACCTHSHEPVQAEMAEGETGNLLHLPTRNVDFLKQKIRPIRMHQNTGKMAQNGVAVTHRTATSTDTNYFGHRQENEL